MLYPESEPVKNRYKRLKKLLDAPFEMHQQNIIDRPGTAVTPAKVHRRRDTVEKNLDEMFSSDQEAEIETKAPERKKIKYDNHDEFSDKLDNSVTLSPIHEPFYGFQENETCQNKYNKEVNTEIKSSISSLPCLSDISQVSSSPLKVDANGNTFGMSSVFASPISDFSSDYEDEILELTSLRKMDLPK